MKATEAKLLEFLKKSPQFVIPIYQRSYSWGKRKCRQLWDDILRAGRNEMVSAHFVGSIVYVEKGLYSITSQAPLLVIDGQQRLARLKSSDGQTFEWLCVTRTLPMSQNAEQLKIS